MTLAGALHNHGFEADLFYNIEDFTQKIAMVPCSAKTKEGIPELIMMLCGLSQKYLGNKLELNKQAKGVILEIKKEKSNNYLEVILYDGELSKNDKIAISNFDGEPIISKIRVMEEVQPLCSKFKSVEKVQASTGLRLQLTEKIDILPGMPFMLYNNNDEEIKKLFKKEISENIKTDKQGIIAKADSLGSLEALLVLLRENNIPVLKVGIGEINKKDIISAKANLETNELNAIVIGFNVDIRDDAKEIKGKTKILMADVIYKLIDELSDYRIEKHKEIEKKRMLGLTTICKLNVLHQHVFRNTSPAIFGVGVEAGKLISGLRLVDGSGEKVGRVKNIQADNKSINETREGKEVAISIPGINFERRMKNVKALYSDISELQFKNFKKSKDLLSQKEISTLQEIAEIKRQKHAEWGMG